MTTCANCTTDALYIYVINDEVTTHFCAAHVPGFLQAQKKAGTLPTVEGFEERKQAVLDSMAGGTDVTKEAGIEAPKKTVSKKKPTTVEVPVEEATVAEIEIVEEVEAVAEDAE